MKWQYYRLPESDQNAKAYLLENLSVGASDHVLSRKIMAHVARCTGSMLLIAFESLDLLDTMDYRFGGSYAGGKALYDVPGVYPVTLAGLVASPSGGLIQFIEGFLRISNDAIVVVEHPTARTSDLVRWETRESRVCTYGEEVYHLLTSENADFESIECATRESLHLWATGVCSSSKNVPGLQVISEDFFDGIVENASHLFTPALDGEAYLIWSPHR
jgi:hypothetical protein